VAFPHRPTRYDVRLGAVVRRPASETVDCLVRNISRGGAFIEAGRLPLGERVTIRLQLPPAADAIELPGTVRWSDASGAGVQFDALVERQVRALEQFFVTVV
jgi:hypothetical protein